MAHLLIVDDDPLVQRSLIRALQSHSCVGAANGIEALRCLEREGFDLVVSDVDMPLMNGIDFYRHVASRFPHLLVVFRTGSSTPGLWELGVPVFAKDDHLAEFAAQIQFLLGVASSDAIEQSQTLSQMGGG